jgi:hypothetical protein
MVISLNHFRQPGYLSNGSGTISNNTVNNTRGWVIEGVGTLSYTGNIFGTNTSHITILNTASNISGLTISNNDLSGTVTDWAIDNRTTGTASAECNWYGTTSSSGVASKITGNVDYTPWLTNGTDNAPALGFQPVPGSCSGTPVDITSATPSPETCVHDNGSIAILYSGGTANYTISWSGQESGSDLTSNTTYTIPTLSAGSYNITITDANGSTATTSVTLEYHPVLNSTTSVTYATIQAAIDAASAGNVIEVCAGTYTEAVTVNTSLTINGPNATIDPNIGSRVPEAVIVGNVKITAPTIIFQGFTINQGSNLRAIEESGGANSLSSNILVKNNIIDGLSTSTSFAIYNGGTLGTHTFEGNLIQTLQLRDGKYFLMEVYHLLYMLPIII